MDNGRGVAVAGVRMLRVLAVSVILTCSPSLAAALLGPQTDPRAIVVAAAGDGRTDDTGAIQAALDRARNNGDGGLVLLPSGRYRITRSLLLWPAVRLYGIGPTRPELVLGDRTAGFQRGIAAMVVFTGGGPHPEKTPAFPVPDATPFNAELADANPDTFFSAISNVDIRIGSGNPAAVGVRFHPAQHSFLEHMNFYTGSGLAGVHQVGNQSQDLHFFGGRYGILAEKPSPAWQFALLDSSFEGQRDAAIREHEAGLTLVNVQFRNIPIAIDIDKGYGDWLFGKRVQFDRISRAGIVISNEDKLNTSINFQDAVARDTPIFSRLRESGQTTASAGRVYHVNSFSYGLMLPGGGQMGRFETRMDATPLAALPAERAPVLRPLPPPGEWVNVRTLGVKGDDHTDDTEALRQAIATHRVLYFPLGRYKVSGTLELRSDTVLIGLHPSLTQLLLTEDAPAFSGTGAARGLIEAPRGGSNIVSGLGLFAGGTNPRATALLWRAGETSLVADVKFEGGHGTQLADGTRFDPYDATHSGDKDPRKRWGGQYPSLWVTDGGGGTFTGIWSPDTYAQAGLYVSNTATPGHIYNVSNEHHVRNEAVLDGVSNWELLDLQSEEEYGESAEAVSLEIRNSHDILIANYHGYRVTRTVRPAASAIRLFNATDIHFRTAHVNAESGMATCDENGCGTILRANRFAYDNALVDVTHGIEERERDFALLDIDARSSTPTPTSSEGWQLQKLAGGFHGLTGAAIDPQGKPYFVDQHRQSIYRWSPERGLEIVRDNTLDAVQLAFDRSGNLMVLSSAGPAGTVYSLRPDAPVTDLTVLAPSAVPVGADTMIALPGNWWVNGEFRDQLDPRGYTYPTLTDLFKREAGAGKASRYISPDGTLALPAFRVFRQGDDDHRGWRWSMPLQAYQLVTAKVGSPVYVGNQSEGVTYSGRVAADGAVAALKPFANRAGESVAVGPDGRVYIADGQILIYAPNGLKVGELDVPERPTGLVFGGAHRDQLFILSHASLFVARRQPKQ